MGKQKEPQISSKILYNLDTPSINTCANSLNHKTYQLQLKHTLTRFILFYIRYYACIYSAFKLHTHATHLNPLTSPEHRIKTTHKHILIVVHATREQSSLARQDTTITLT